MKSLQNVTKDRWRILDFLNVFLITAILKDVSQFLKHVCLNVREDLKNKWND